MLLRLQPLKLEAAEDTQMTLVSKSAQEAQLENRPRALLLCSAPHPCRQERQVEDASLRGDLVGLGRALLRRTKKPKSWNFEGKFCNSALTRTHARL